MFLREGFLQCGKQGPLFIVVHRPLIIAASLVAEHRLQARRLSSCGSWAQPLRGMWDPPRPGLEPVSPAPAGRPPTTAPPGKPQIHFLNGFVYLLLSCVSSLYILDIDPLPDIWFANIFSYSVGFLFILLMVSFAVQKLFSLMYSHLFIFAFAAFAFGVKFKKISSRLLSRNLLPMFSSRSFMVQVLCSSL